MNPQMMMPPAMGQMPPAQPAFPPMGPPDPQMPTGAGVEGGQTALLLQLLMAMLGGQSSLSGPTPGAQTPLPVMPGGYC